MTFRLQLALVALFFVSASLWAADNASVPSLVKAPGHTEYDALLRNGFTIHGVRHEVRGENTRVYQDGGSFVDVPTAQIESIESVDVTDPVEPTPVATQSRAAVSIPDAVNAASGKHGIDPDLISSVIRAESGFNPHAVSRKGAQGLMQLMPATASKLGVRDSFDPAANVDGGTQYLSDLLSLYHGDIIKALAAYNAGPERVAQYHGVPPYRETRAYVASIVRDFNRKKLAAEKHSAPKQSASNRHVQPGASKAASQ